MLIVVALIAFKVTQIIEDNINNIPGSVKSKRPSYLLPTVIAVAAGLLLIVLPPQPAGLVEKNS